MCKEFVTDYEFVKVNEHKSHLLMNCTDLEKLGAEMESPFAKEWDKKIIVGILYIRSNLLRKSKGYYLRQYYFIDCCSSKNGNKTNVNEVKTGVRLICIRNQSAYDVSFRAESERNYYEFNIWYKAKTMKRKN